MSRNITIKTNSLCVQWSLFSNTEGTYCSGRVLKSSETFCRLDISERNLILLSSISFLCAIISFTFSSFLLISDSNHLDLRSSSISAVLLIAAAAVVAASMLLPADDVEATGSAAAVVVCCGWDTLAGPLTEQYKYNCCRWQKKWWTTTMWVKNPPWGFLAFIPKQLGIFSPNFTCLLHVPIYVGLHFFIQLPATLTKLCHIKPCHPVHTICSKCPASAETHAGNAGIFLTFFPNGWKLFSPNFTDLLHVPIYAKAQIFIQLSPTVTKLCHIKCDHTACVSADDGHFEHMMVVAFNMA